MGAFEYGRYRYVGGGKGRTWTMFDKNTGRKIKVISFKEAKARFAKAYDNKLIRKIMRRQGMKGKDGRKVAKGLIKAWRLGIIGSDALY